MKGRIVNGEIKGNFTVEGVIDLIHHYRPRCLWKMDCSTHEWVKRIQNPDGKYPWVPDGYGGPGTLMGFPIIIVKEHCLKLVASIPKGMEVIKE